MGKKRSKPGSSSSAIEEEMTGQDLGTENELYRELKESIECVKSLVTEGLARLHGDLDILRNEFKTDFKEMSCTIRDLEKSLNFTQVEVDSFKKQLKKESEERSSELELLTAKITILEQSLKQAVEQNITLEQYTRRENLRFNNIKEHEGEDCEKIICDTIRRDLGLDISEFRFHAVHRIGKRDGVRCRPIIARFISRQDRDKVWSKRGKIKESSVHRDAYITEDYARAIQKEREVLIKAMLKARNEHNLTQAKVKGRYLYINGERFSFENVPEYLK